MSTLDEIYDSLFVAALSKASDMAVDGLVTRAINTMSRHGNALEQGAVAPPTNVSTRQIAGAPWGPERLIVNANDPYGYTPEPSFNCDYNNPNYGDERALVIAKQATHATANGWSTHIAVQPGAQYLIRIYYHNSSDPTKIAINTRVFCNIPSEYASRALVTAFISANNSAPRTVWGNTIFESTTPFRLEYVPGSAKLYSNTSPQGLQMGDGVYLPNGELVGDLQDGKVPGGYQASGIVVFIVRS